ncbi:hypothetical protein F7P69_01410 [Cellulosimicrobium funkei]|nr:hypothetical protein [Cellulosimicrobium funkei]
MEHTVPPTIAARLQRCPEPFDFARHRRSSLRLDTTAGLLEVMPSSYFAIELGWHRPVEDDSGGEAAFYEVVGEGFSADGDAAFSLFGVGSFADADVVALGHGSVLGCVGGEWFFWCVVGGEGGLCVAAGWFGLGEAGLAFEGGPEGCVWVWVWHGGLLLRRVRRFRWG